MRDTPSSASRIGDGEPESRRPRARNAGRRQKRTWHALQQADVEVHLVPLNGDTLDLGERERGGRLPVRRRAQDQVVLWSGNADGQISSCMVWPNPRSKLAGNRTSVSRIRLFWP